MLGETISIVQNNGATTSTTKRKCHALNIERMNTRQRRDTKNRLKLAWVEIWRLIGKDVSCKKIVRIPRFFKLIHKKLTVTVTTCLSESEYKNAGKYLKLISSPDIYRYILLNIL